MQINLFKRNISQAYLVLIPFLTFAIVLALGHTSYKIYLPLGLIMMALAVIAAWILGAHAIKNSDAEKRHLVIIASLLIIPWLLLCILSGIGPPPFDKPEEYVATATEQQVRYSFLLVGGVVATFGFTMLKEKLKKSGEDFYSWIGFIAMMIAAPLFVMNMAYYDNFMLETYKIRVASSSDKMPEWFSPAHSQFHLITLVEVALTFLATAAFAASLKSAGWFKKAASNVYIIISILCFFDAILSYFFPAVGIVLIPALPFIMPYLIGVNLMRRAGN